MTTQVSPERLIDKLRKLEELVTRGVDGERDKARILRDAIAEKYGISLDTIIEQPTAQCEFKFGNPNEKKLLIHCLLWVCQTHMIPNLTKGKRLICWLTETQKIDLTDCYAHYLKAYRQGVDDFTAAFIHKHNLFSEVKDAPNKTSQPKRTNAQDEDRLRRIRNLMTFMDKTKWDNRKKLTESK